MLDINRFIYQGRVYEWDRWDQVWRSQDKEDYLLEIPDDIIILSFL